MDIEQKVRAIGEKETTFVVDASLVQGGELVHQTRHIQHNTVADDVDLTGVEHTTGKKVEREFLAINNKSVTGVASAVESANEVVVISEDIDKLTLTLVTPLGTQYSSDLRSVKGVQIYRCRYGY